VPDPATVLQGLDPEQRRVAEALRGPVRVLAGAGTGKTRAITHRIAHGVATGVYQPTEVLAVTFTTRAAGEMRGRLRGLGAEGVQARTFHSAALRQLRYFWPHVHGTELPTLTESKLGMVATAASRQRVRADQATLRDVASEIEWAKVSNVRPDDYARLALRTGRSVNNVDPETVGRIFGTYEDVKRSQARMDMEDVLLLTAGMLADDERVAAQVRRQYKWFVVDEYQDVSPIQSALLDLWLGGRDELCVVGDPAQTIYSFAGADASYLRDFPKKYAGTTSIDLVRNYRSTPEVIAAANGLLAGTASAGVRLQAQVASGPAVTYAPYADEVAEAAAVAAAVERLRDGGTPPGEMAVLFRINAQSEAYEEALAARGLPYVLRGAARFFDRGEVREAVTRLRGAARGGTTLGESLEDAVRGVLGGMGWTPEAPAARGQTRDRWESLQALVDQAAEVQSAAGVTEQVISLDAFVDDLDRRAAEQHAPVAGGVTLATLHAAKGLEWDAVFVVGVCEGTLPITYADTPTAVEEERRLLYVGITRARRSLSVSWARARNPGGRQTRKPSRFLDALLPASARVEPVSARSRKVVSCRECGKPLATSAEKKRGRCSDCPASYDEELFEQLRTWRSGQAAEESVPAYVVFTDATLQLIAEHKPRSADALLRINGIGRAKLDRYGEAVLGLVG
jgi:DNA helicase-2/ATP-dependent DNA helicase PcrA